MSCTKTYYKLYTRNSCYIHNNEIIQPKPLKKKSCDSPEKQHISIKSPDKKPMNRKSSEKSPISYKSAEKPRSSKSPEKRPKNNKSPEKKHSTVSSGSFRKANVLYFELIIQLRHDSCYQTF